MKRSLVLLTAMIALCVAFAAQPVQLVSAQQAGAVTTPTDSVYAAWQPFQGGVMMWWSDTDQIWVFINNGNATYATTMCSNQQNGQLQVWPDLYVEGAVVNTGTAPSGLFTPIRGFGIIWAVLGGSGSQLRYALSPELGYDSAGRVGSGSQFTVKGPGNTTYSVTLSSGAISGSWCVISAG